jgi:hypothetical protein
MRQPIDKALKDNPKKLEDFVQKIYSANYTALTSAARSNLISNINKNRKLIYDKKLRTKTYDTYSGAADYNLPIAHTDVKGFNSRYINIIMNAAPLVQIENKPEWLDYDSKVKIERNFTLMFENDLKGATFLNDFLKHYHIDGIVGYSVSKEVMYRSNVQYKTYLEWQENKDFDRLLSEQYDEGELSNLHESDILSLVVPSKIKNLSLKPLTLDDIIIPDDFLVSEQSKAEFTTERWYKKADDIYKMSQAGYLDKENTNELMAICKEAAGGYDKEDYDIEQDRFLLQFTNVGEISKYQKGRELFRSFVYCDINNDKYDKLYEVIIDRYSRKCLRFALWRDDIIPIGLAVYDSETPYAMTARSYVDYASTLHEAACDMFNNNINSSRLQSGLMGKFRINSGFDPDEDPLAPFKMIGLRNLADFDLMRPPEMSPSAYQLEQQLNAYRQSFAGLLDQTMPSASNVLKHRTSSGIAQVIGQGNILIQANAHKIKPYFADMFNLIFRYSSNNRNLRVKLNFNIMNAVSDMKQAAVHQIFATFMSIPQVAQNPNAVRKLSQMYYESFGLEGFDEIFSKEMAEQPGVPNLEQMSNPENALRQRNKDIREGGPQ